MRVLHIGKFFPPHPGGIERVCAELCAGLQQHQVDTALVAHAEPGTHRTRRRRVGDVDVTLVACHGRWLYAPVSPGFLRALNAAIRRFRPDLLHIHVPNTSAFWTLLSSEARRLPWVMHWHADIPLETSRRALRAAYRIYRPWEQALLRRASAVIATSAAYLESSEALAPWRDKVHVIPLGLPPIDRSFQPPATESDSADARTDSTSMGAASAPSPPTASGERVGVRGQRPDDTGPQTDALPPQPNLSPIADDGGEGAFGAAAGDNTAQGGMAPRLPNAYVGGTVQALWPAAGLRLLAVGRLSYFKGFDVLLRALAKVPGANLVLVGAGECDPALRRLSQSLGISGRVKFAGRIDIDASGSRMLASLYERADVFCLPSINRAESFGLVLLEAMRAGTATIASDIPGSGVGLIVRHEETGLLVPPGDAEALAAAIRRLSAHAGLRNELGERGLTRWREEFTLDRCVQRTLALYRQLLETPRHDTTASTM